MEAIQEIAAKIAIPKRITGQITTPSKERYVDDLSNYTKAQLEDIAQREAKLVRNKKCMQNLPDKGKRIRDFYDKIQKEIGNRDEMERAAKLFSNLNIASEGKKTITSMEWNGKYDPAQLVLNSDDDDDDDDDNDPLKILAQSRDLTKHVKILKPEKPLITEEDLNEIDSFQHTSNGSPGKSTIYSKVNLEPHAVYVCQKEIQSNEQEKFLPHKTTKSDVHSVANEKNRKLSKHWEITAATPPVLRNSQTKALSLKESIEIQAQQITKQKQMEEEHARERLAIRQKLVNNIEQLSTIPGNDINYIFNSYRDLADENNSDDEIDDYISDEVDE